MVTKLEASAAVNTAYQVPQHPYASNQAAAHLTSITQTPPHTRLPPPPSVVLSPTFGRSGLLSPLFRGDVTAMLADECCEPMQPNISMLSPDCKVSTAGKLFKVHAEEILYF